MSRKRTELDPAVEAQIVALMKRGGTSRSIYATLTAQGIKGLPSHITIARRMRELKAGIKAGIKATRAAKIAPAAVLPIPDKPEDIPEGTSLSVLDEWIGIASQQGKFAEAEGDLDGLGKMGRLVASLLEARRKATPPDTPDPNDHPDMVALGDWMVREIKKCVRLSTAAK